MLEQISIEPNEAGISRQIYTECKANRYSLSGTRYGAGGMVSAGRIESMMAHRMPESANALWRMVSLTAAKTRRIFEVSVACVRL